jgi:DNA polymerase-1
MIVLDCETEEIIGNPVAHPPAGHGLAYIVPGAEPGYLHYRTEKANCKWSAVADFMDNILKSGEPLLFHNAAFDISVLKAEFPLCPWGLLTPDRVHDTMYQLFLADPYATTLSLKPSAERYLDMPAEEQNDLFDWIVKNVRCTRKEAGAHIVKAPLELILPYATGDVIRTLGIYEHLKDKVPQEPYDRERQLLPILMAASKKGLRVNTGALEQALDQAQAALEAADNRVRTTLHTPALDVSSGSELADACERTGVVSEWIRTPTGERSTAKDNLVKCIKDPELVRLLFYRSSLATCIGTFMINWLEMAKKDGRLHPSWNQVRNYEKGKKFGTRTGRLSCDNPNLQNVPTEFEEEVPEGLPYLPFMRQFLLPEEGHIWLKRDFSSQEIRIAAHFEDGQLLAAYQANPDLDPHQMAKEMILETTHKDYNRKHVKTTGFQIIYGGGAPAISMKVGCSRTEAAELKEAYFTAMPGIRDLAKDTSRMGRAGEAITTWGGRKYYREIDLKYPSRDFSYKLLNYLIQGSAADQTKQCIIDWDASRYPGSVFLATVHDEINISAPIDEWKDHMEHLRETMNADRLDCPMRSDGFKGINWHEIEKCE